MPAVGILREETNMKSNIASKLDLIVAASILFTLLGFLSGEVRAQGDGTGTITGTVTTPLYDRYFQYGRVPVIYVEKVDGKTFTPEKSVMDQKAKVFVPHVLPVVAGTTVDFLNSDDMGHNVFTPDEIADKFNLGTWPKGEVRSYTFKNLGTAIMLCQKHDEMDAWVVVLQNPYFAKPGSDGKYTIEGVPAGTYQLKTWHEKYVGLPSQAVTVKAGETTNSDFEIRRK